MQKIAPKKLLCIFFLAYLFIYGIIPSVLFHTIYMDTAQNIAWGNIYAWGYNEHPPLGAWLIATVNFFLKNNALSGYFLGALCLISSLWITYKIACIYFSEETAIAVTLLSSLSYYYVGTFALVYNQNTIMLPFWLGTVYFFIRALKDNSASDWLLLTLCAVLSILSKYQSGVILLLELIYLIFHYKKEYFYPLFFSLILFLALLTPHFYWLCTTGFLPIQYALGSAQLSGQQPLFLIGHILYPFLSLIKPVLNLLAVFAALFFCVSRGWLRLNKQIKKNSSKNILLYFSVIPLLFFFVISLLTGANIKSEFGFPLVSLSILGIFSYFQIESVNLKKLFKLITILQCVVFLLYILSQYFLEKSQGEQFAEMHFPATPMVTIAKATWEEAGYSIDKLKFVGGDGDRASYYLASYLPSKPWLLVSNSLMNSPWISKKLFLQSKGILVYKGCDQKALDALVENKFTILKGRCITLSSVNRLRPNSVPYMLYIAKPKASAF